MSKSWRQVKRLAKLPPTAEVSYDAIVGRLLLEAEKTDADGKV